MRDTRRGTTHRTLAATAMLSLGLGTVLIGITTSASAAEGAECVPSEGTAATFSAWAPAGSTDWQTDSTPPADPDGRAGEDNPQNLQMIGAPVETQEIVTQEARAATEAHWSDLVWHTYRGNQPDSAPGLDDPSWLAVPAAPQAATHSVPPRVPGVPYNVSQGPSGNGSWYLWTGTWVPGDPGQQEVRRTEYRWPILTRTYTAGTAPVTCEPDVLGTDSRQRTVEGDPSCSTDTVPVRREQQDGVETSAGVWEWSAWTTVSETTRRATKKECPGPEVDPGNGSNPGDGSNVGNGPDSKGGEEPEVLGVAAKAPAAVAPASSARAAAVPAAVPTAVDAGLMATAAESGSSPTLWILAGAAFAMAGLLLGFAPATPRGTREI